VSKSIFKAQLKMAGIHTALWKWTVLNFDTGAENVVKVRNFGDQI